MIKLVGSEDLSDFLMDQRFDKNNHYSIPYFWGTIGIMVNSDQIDPTTIHGWADYGARNLPTIF